MIIAKPFNVQTLWPCRNQTHHNCPTTTSTEALDIICDCRCHYREETPMSETTTSTTSTTSTKRVYTKWTPEQIQTLRENASQGSAKVAELLGRPESQIKTKAATLGISLRKPGSNGGRRQKDRG